MLSRGIFSLLQGMLRDMMRTMSRKLHLVCMTRQETDHKVQGACKVLGGGMAMHICYVPPTNIASPQNED